MSDSHLILVVDDSPTQVLQMRIILEQEGYRVITAGDGLEGLEAIRENNPELVVTDLEMPKMNGLELVKSVNAERPSLPVILTTSRGSEELAVSAMSSGATSYVPKRNLEKNLAETVARTLSVVAIEHEKRSFTRFLTKLCFELKIDNDEDLMHKVNARLEVALMELELIDEMTSMNVSVALDEALRNAMVHGNLEVPSELRDEDGGKAYIDLIAERRLQEPYASRKVTIELRADRDEAAIIVTDEGPGFDASMLSDPTSPDNWEDVGGRGLLLINAFMDEVCHNEVGNQITMIKRRGCKQHEE